VLLILRGRARRALGGRLRLAGAEPGGGDVGPGMAVRACRAYRGRSGEREGGMDLRGGPGQRPVLVISDDPGVTVGEGQQASGLDMCSGLSLLLQMAESPSLLSLKQRRSPEHESRAVALLA
jgi:hypothetical protein